MSNFITAFFYGGWWGERGKFVEIDDNMLQQAKV
jgi:hypothetical protein